MTEPLVRRPFGNPLAHPDPRVRVLNSALFLGLLHVGLFLWGNERATPLRLTLSFTLMLGALAAIAWFRTWQNKRSARPFPGAAP